MQSNMQEQNISKTEEQWREDLTPEQYEVLREKGTEKPFTGQYVDHNEEGIYTCVGCGNELFAASSKFDSHCGWPSFDDVMDGTGVVTVEDASHGMHRTEVTCAKCGGHLGHIFPDGPKDTTGLRYCVNSIALNFKPKKDL
jgi:peptide-methionine (R)-S-oxide reductase